MDHGFNLRPGINYCAPVRQISFRGASGNQARLIPLPEKSDNSEEIFFFHGVEVPANQLPYLPEMGDGSPFKAHGYCHRYKIVRGIFIVNLTPKPDNSSFFMDWVLQAILFEGEVTPRIFLDNRRELSAMGIINPQDASRIDTLLAEKSLVLH